MKEMIKGFDELNEKQKEIAIENYKHMRTTDEDADSYDYDSYTEEDWKESAACYSYLVQEFDDGSECISCLF